MYLVMKLMTYIVYISLSPLAGGLGTKAMPLPSNASIYNDQKILVVLV